MVKHGDIVKLEGPFQAEALRILRAIPGLTVTAEPGPTSGMVQATLGFAGGQVRMEVQMKRWANAATAWQLVHEAEARPHSSLLFIADGTTTQAREILRQHGVGVIDGLGNAHIELPGLLFHLEGRGRRPQPRPTRLSGKAGLIAQTLLLQPNRMWQVKDVAAEAHLSMGLAHRVLARLEMEGVVAAEGAGPSRVRRVTDPGALLDLWAEEHVERPKRTLAYLLAQTPQQLTEALGANLKQAGVDYALTGAAAASLVAPFITTVPVVDVWVTAIAAPEELYGAAKADPVVDGQNVVFLQGKDDTPLEFREEKDNLWLVDRFRLYVDLRRDPRRGREQAEHLRRELIGF